jgi:protein phosphatase
VFQPPVFPLIKEISAANQARLQPARNVLALRIGQATRTNHPSVNEDYAGVVTPERSELDAKGALLALADGVSGTNGGRTAAEHTVRGLLADYYATPESWEVPLSLDKVASAINRWIVAHGAANRELAGMACTLSALVLRGSRFYLAHVGDTRIYRIGQDGFSQLTQDHVWDRPDMQHVLKRAIGLDQHLVMDYADGEMAADDLFLICSDGVWEPLGEDNLAEILARHRDNPQAAADALVDAASQADAKANATALVVRVDAVSDLGWRDTLKAGSALPVPPSVLTPGQHLDEFQILEQIHESRATLLYKVRSYRTGQHLVLKTLQPHLGKDAGSCEALLAEEWLAKRVVSPHVAQVVPMAPHARHFLYYVMAYHPGLTLQDELDGGRHFTSADITRLGMQLLRGLGVLHRLSVTHGHVEPSNLLHGEDGTLRILDLGEALATGVPYSEPGRGPETTRFTAPEVLEGGEATFRSDLFSAGATLYHLLTRKFPHGGSKGNAREAFGDPPAPTRFRPDIPSWLENVLLRAVAPDPARRFETAEEMLLALERGGAQPLPAPTRTPLLQRRYWRWRELALISVLINLVLLAILLAGH